MPVRCARATAIVEWIGAWLAGSAAYAGLWNRNTRRQLAASLTPLKGEDHCLSASSTASVAAYKADPTSDNLRALLVRAAALDKETPWRNMRAKGALTIPFTEIRALCDRQLTSEEIARFAGCLGYALKATLAGEELSEPEVCYPAAPGLTFTILEFRYDSLSTTRSDPDLSLAFTKAREYVFEGDAAPHHRPRGQGNEGHPACRGHCPLQPLLLPAISSRSDCPHLLSAAVSRRGEGGFLMFCLPAVAFPSGTRGPGLPEDAATSEVPPVEQHNFSQ